MSRSGYNDEAWDDTWATIRWRGAVTSAIRGRKGQAFLKELLAALDALPEKKLVADVLESPEGAVCALGAVGKARSIDMAKIDPEDQYRVAGAFSIPYSLACEIMYMNDETWGSAITPEDRFERMRRWVVSQLQKEES